MKKLFRALAALVLAGAASFASAQTVPISLSWTNPITSVDGVPLTGANALTAIEVHWATATIDPAALSRAPQVTLGTVQATVQTIAATNGSTLYFRVRAVRGTEKSGFSNEASKLIALSTVPGVPTNLQIAVQVTRNEDGSTTYAVVAVLDEAREQTIYVGGSA